MRPDAITFQPVVRKACSGPPAMVSHSHVILSAASDLGLPGLHVAAAADGAVALPRIVGARPGAGSDGDRLLRFASLARGDLRRLSRRAVLGPQPRQSGASLSARRRPARRLG